MQNSTESIKAVSPAYTEKTIFPFPFDFEPNGIPFGSKSKGKLSLRSYPIQCESKYNASFPSVCYSYGKHFQTGWGLTQMTREGLIHSSRDHSSGYGNTLCINSSPGAQSDGEGFVQSIFWWEIFILWWKMKISRADYKICPLLSYIYVFIAILLKWHI